MGGSVARSAGGITNDPPIGYHAIHIIVKNGNVTLTGVVDSEADLAMAGMRANSVSGVFANAETRVALFEGVSNSDRPSWAQVYSETPAVETIADRAGVNHPGLQYFKSKI